MSFVVRAETYSVSNTPGLKVSRSGVRANEREFVNNRNYCNRPHSKKMEAVVEYLFFLSPLGEV